MRESSARVRILTWMLVLVLAAGMAACSREDSPTDPVETRQPTEQVTVSLSGSGTQEDPWLAGSPEESSIRIFIAASFLVAEGQGEMMDFQAGDVLPWTAASREVDTFFLDAGITTIGAYAFCGLGREDMGISVYLPEELRRIGAGAFENTVFEGSLSIPETTETVESRAFAGTTAFGFELAGHPRIAEDAFAGAEAKVSGRSAMGWTAEAPAFCKDGAAWSVQHTFSYEVNFGSSGMSMSGEIFLSAEDTYMLDAVLTFAEDGYHFDHYELVEGDLPVEDPTAPMLELSLTGDARMRIWFEAD